MPKRKPSGFYGVVAARAQQLGANPTPEQVSRIVDTDYAAERDRYDDLFLKLVGARLWGELPRWTEIRNEMMRFHNASVAEAAQDVADLALAENIIWAATEQPTEKAPVQG